MAFSIRRFTPGLSQTVKIGMAENGLAAEAKNVPTVQRTHEEDSHKKAQEFQNVSAQKVFLPLTRNQAVLSQTMLLNVKRTKNNPLHSHKRNKTAHAGVHFPITVSCPKCIQLSEASPHPPPCTVLRTRLN